MIGCKKNNIMNTKKLFIWIKVCVVCFLVVLNSCEKPKPPEPPVKFSIVGYINVPNAVLIEAYRVLGIDVPHIVTIASNEVDNGNFKIILPDTLNSELVINISVIFPAEMNYEVSSPDANFAQIGYIGLYKSYNPIPPNWIGQPLCGKVFEKRDTPTEYYLNRVVKYWYYVDRDVTVGGTYKGQRVIQGIPGTDICTPDLSLKKGWNEVYEEEIWEINRQPGGTYTWTTIITTTKYAKYVGLEWYLWDGTF